MEDEKRNLRLYIKRQKELHSRDRFLYRESALIHAIEALPAFGQTDTVLLYYSLNDEVPTEGMINRWSENKRILLPAITKDNDIQLRLYRNQDHLATGRYGIREPLGDPFTAYERIGLAIVPGMAFDSSGHRLGRGKGYYDKLLARLPQAYKIGVCYPFQLLERVPADRHDIVMDRVITLSE